MNAQPDVKKLVLQTQQYEFSDGLRDLQYAWMMAVIGVTVWLYIDQASLWISVIRDLEIRFGGAGKVLSYGIVALPWIPILASVVAMRSLRKRWLWRESGYVQSKASFLPVHVMVISVIIVVVGIALGLFVQITMQTLEPIFFRVMLVSSGWAFGYTLAETGRKLALARYVRVAVLGSFITAVLLILPLTIGQTGLLWGLIWSVLLVISGWQPLQNALRIVRKTHND